MFSVTHPSSSFFVPFQIIITTRCCCFPWLCLFCRPSFHHYFSSRLHNYPLWLLLPLVATLFIVNSCISIHKYSFQGWRHIMCEFHFWKFKASIPTTYCSQKIVLLDRFFKVEFLFVFVQYFFIQLHLG